VGDRRRRFFALVGGDYAGKSAALEGMAGEVGWALVSGDDANLEPPYDTLPSLRRLFVKRVLPHAGGLLSPDYVLSGLQMSLVYLRDRIVAEAASRDVLADSYYYKVLAKCALLGFVNEAIFGLWRSFPTPDRVIYLSTSPETAWRRATASGRLNRFEHYAAEPSADGFLRFQRDLAALMLDEIGPVPVDFVDGEQEPATVRTQIRALLAAGPEDRIKHGRSSQPLLATGPGRAGAVLNVG
jgi:hypothetical protein